jgi:hypothetical protein
MVDRGAAVKGSMELGAAVCTALGGNSIVTNTDNPVSDPVRNQDRRDMSSQFASNGDGMKNILAAVNTARGTQWTSRKRVRHDMLRLVREGQTCS